MNKKKIKRNYKPCNINMNFHFLKWRIKEFSFAWWVIIALGVALIWLLITGLIIYFS